MKTKLLTAKARDHDEIIHFDIDGRIYELNLLTGCYGATERFVHLDYYGLALLMLPPEYLRTGGYDPTDDVTYEICDE